MTQIEALYAAIAALATALATTSTFLYKRQSRSEERLTRQLQEEADRCEREKVRMFTFSTSLIQYITVLADLTCPLANCPIRKAIPAMPKPTAADMGLRVEEQQQQRRKDD